MNKSFEGKVVFITGANSGIGEATAAAFVEAGATVFATARRTQALEEARKRHPKIHWLLNDVTKAKDVKATVESVFKEAARIDVVVNNAAVAIFGPLEAATEDSLRSQFEANVFGPTYVTQAALPALKASKGQIINISSAAGHKAAPGAAHYGATKAALESMTKSWALELAPHGIRVNALAPGPTDTPVFAKIGGSPEAAAAIMAAFVKQVPLGRAASTDEMARWVVSMADPTVTFMTGQVLSIDGGMGLT